MDAQPAFQGSPRQKIAAQLLVLCLEDNLNNSYGASTEKAKDRGGLEHWSILFYKDRVLDGVIQVYRPRFILIA